MEDKQNEIRETDLVKVETLNLENMSMATRQQAERLYHQLGLDPFVDQVLKSFPGNLSKIDQVTDRIFGPYDIKSRAEEVAKVAALVTYATLGKQFTEELGKKERELEQTKTNYDALVQKVADVVDEDYDELKESYSGVVGKLSEMEHLKSQVTSMNLERAELVKKIAGVLGGDYEEMKANYSDLMEKLSEMDHLKSQIGILNEEKAQLAKSYEASEKELKENHQNEVNALDGKVADLGKELEDTGNNLRDRIAEIAQLNTQISKLSEGKAQLTNKYEASEKELKKNHRKEVNTLEGKTADLSKELEELTEAHKLLLREYEGLRQAIRATFHDMPYGDIRSNLGEELQDFMLSDSAVPDMVIEGVGKFIDFQKYLGEAAERGAKEATGYIDAALKQLLEKKTG
ncbi:MAG: hypothetical protein ABIB93_03495 [Chloroflexota bacterium]